MEFLFIILLAVIAATIANVSTKQKTTTACKMHKWVYDIQGFLFCSQCKNRPGEIQTDYDKPY